jgi:Tat protein translocase TatB subunit
MLNIGPLELLLIFLIALIVVGPKKLPDLGRTIGRGMREFRKAQDEVRQSLQLEELKDMKREISDTQRGVRDALRFDTPKTGAKPRAPIAAGDAPEASDAATTAQGAAEKEPAAGEGSAPAPPDEPAGPPSDPDPRAG